MKKIILLALVAVLVVGGLVFYFLNPSNQTKTSNSSGDVLQPPALPE